MRATARRAASVVITTRPRSETDSADSQRETPYRGQRETPYRGRKRLPTWRDLRESRGWSIRELEERSGVDRGLLSLIERGRMAILPDQAERILAAYRESRADE